MSRDGQQSICQMLGYPGDGVIDHLCYLPCLYALSPLPNYSGEVELSLERLLSPRLWLAVEGPCRKKQ